MPTRQGSFHLFRLFGIDVYLHWAWFLAVAYFIHQARGYSSSIWSVLECLSLFLIVLIHEFGHQLACRQVGGKTSQIILWPLGGVAYVSPPQRPGAQLWSIAAGPLVNVILFPILFGLWLLAGHLGWDDTLPDLFRFLNNLWQINLVLLIFNMMPVYPLDGGQILRSLLWFVLGRANSLLAASIIGFIGVAVLIVLAALLLFISPDPSQGIWLGIMATFILLNCWGGLMQARALARIAKMPRRNGFACPVCKIAPPVGAIWRCGKCGKPFDTFATQATCPNCGTQFSATQCLDCGSLRPVGEWTTSPYPPPIINV
jgi:Zn-dependent protease